MPAERAGGVVAIHTLGCKVNRTESEAYAEGIVLGGGTLAEGPGAARVVVVNTCTVTGEADAKARKAVRRALQQVGPDGRVIVTGCLAAIDAAALRALGERVVVEPDRDRVVARALQAAGVASGPPQAGAHRRGSFPSRSGEAFRTRVMVKVQDGCERRCAYCIVPDARGGPRSEPASAVVARVERLVAAGTREIVLTGIDIGGYRDADAGDLGGLVRMLAATGVERIRVSSVEPLDLDDRLLEALAGVPAVLPHLHVPLQSGSDRVLSAMGRGYDTGAFADAIGRARAAMPGLVVSTDMIAGFPGETDAEALASVEFARACGFVKVHAFRYSRRAGTPAAAMPDQVAPPVIAARAAALRELSDELEAAHGASRRGGRAEMLVERVRGTVATGTTEDYLRVRIDARGVATGDLVVVILGEPGPDGLLTARVVPDTAGGATPSARR